MVIACAVACGPQQPVQVESVSAIAPRDGVFLHISHGPEDPHRVLMALRMAEIMVADHDVLVYFDITGIEAVLADAPDLEMAPFGSSRETIAALVEGGVSVFACPSCLEAAGKTADDLMPGVRIADKNAFFNFTEGRILTLDY
jgi:predicted peroxiredoxin